MRFVSILKLFYAFIVICALSSCSSRNQYIKKQPLDDWCMQEAKLYDIPFLIDACPEKCNSSSDDHEKPTSCVQYRAVISLADAIIFYEQEMERYGWDLLTAFVENEALLIFEKPSKMCAVSMRPYKGFLKVIIYSKPKD